MSFLKEIHDGLTTVLQDLNKHTSLDERHLLIVGVSTSEVIGEKIGTAGSEEVASALFEALHTFHEKTGVQLAFQGCEHINRALVIERHTAEMFRLEEVMVRPHRKAGGAMSTLAFQQLKDPVIVEHIQADAGIDIGDTFIGMHLKHVAVPIRSSVTSIGDAHVTMAKTRPKLIGGARAQYPE